MEIEKGEEIELEQEYAIIDGLPENMLDLVIDVDIYQDGEISKVRTEMGMRELADAIEETRGWYTPGILDVPDDELDHYESPKDCLVVCLPTNAVYALVKTRVYMDGRLEDFEKRMDLADIRRAFQMAEKDYIPSDAKFMLTDKGRELAEQLMKEYE